MIGDKKMLECLTSIFHTLHVLIGGENNSTEGGMPFPKLGLEVQSLSPLPGGRSHSVCQLVLLLWSRELRNRELKKVWALELAFSSLLSAGEYCYYKQQIIKEDNQCILLTGSHILRGLGPPLWGHLFTSWKLTFKGAFQSSFVCCYVPGGDEMCFKICIFKGVVACRSIKRNSLLCTSLCWTLLQNDHQSKLQPLVNLPLTVLIRRCYTIPNPNALIS